MIILIPAYKPDESLVRLAQQIIELDAHAEVLVVDDGSGGGRCGQRRPVRPGFRGGGRDRCCWVR